MNDDDKAKAIVGGFVLLILVVVMLIRWPNMTPAQKAEFWQTVVEAIGDDDD